METPFDPPSYGIRITDKEFGEQKKNLENEMKLREKIEWKNEQEKEI